MGAASPACEPGPREPAARSVLRHVRLENLAAGVSGGVLATLALHPLDLVKIRFAVSDGLELRPKYNGILHCMATVWKHEGLRGLYQGVTPNMVGAGASWGLYFFFYNAIKAYKKEGKMESLSASEHLVSAAEAGAMTLCITNPVWVTKTRLVLQYNAGVDPSKRQYRGMFDALIKIYKTEGIRGLYKVMTSRCIHQCLEVVKKPILVQSDSSPASNAAESWNHRMARVGRDLKDILVPTPLWWAGTPSTSSDCSEPHPAWP